MSNPIFTKVDVKSVDSNTFDLSHDRKMSLDMGLLIPTLVIDTLPGDKFNISSAQMIRFSPLIAPVMHKIRVYMHYWYVPARIVWEPFYNWISGGEDGQNTNVAPYFSFTGEFDHVPLSSLADYMGLPQMSNLTDPVQINAIPFAAYQKIYQEFYRDQNLINDVATQLVDGSNIWANFNTLRKRAWSHDYFTSALPFTQKGVEATIPLGSYADLEFYGAAQGNPLNGYSVLRKWLDGSAVATSGGVETDAITGAIQSQADPEYQSVDVTDHTRVNLMTATAASINDLRRAFRLQEWLEKNARGGSRPNEHLKVHWNVRSSDARLQRPEYIGGSISNVVISEVLQLSQTTDGDDASPQGNMAGHAINVGNNGTVTKYCEEHGYIIGLMSILPDTAYFQGIPKHFQKFDKFDYAWPTFALLGEQPIQNQELFVHNLASEREGTFGYIPRYAEYKFINSTVHGDFRDTLRHWHMARVFNTQPTLNQAFIESNPTDRIFAVTDAGIDNLYCHIFNKVKVNRKLPVMGTPSI